MLAKALRIFGYVWLTLAGLLILAGVGAIWYFNGFGSVLNLMSPFSPANYIALIVTLAPGVLALIWAENIEEKRLIEEARRKADS